METIEKLNKEFDMLYKVYDSLFDILEHAGHDTETKYKKAYIDLLQSAKELNSDLYKLLEDHSEVIMDVEYEVERVSTNSLANHMANEAIGAARRTGKALGNVS
jgi:hypothetical protein